MAAAKALDFHIEAARERQRAAGRFDGKNEDNTPKLINVQLVASLPQAETPDPEEKKPFASNADGNKARSQAGKLLNVSGRSVAAAAVVLKHGTDDEKKDVETGTVGLAKVEKQVRVRAKNMPRPKEKQLEMRICLTMLVQ